MEVIKFKWSASVGVGFWLAFERLLSFEMGGERRGEEGR